MIKSIPTLIAISSDLTLIFFINLFINSLQFTERREVAGALLQILSNVTYTHSRCQCEASIYCDIYCVTIFTHPGCVASAINGNAETMGDHRVVLTCMLARD